ncbi:MAG: hypothetical protein ABEH66_06535 [Halobacteriales archaeon]
MAGDPDDDRQGSEGGVVDPSELDIEDDEHVQALGDNRYVVSADDPIAEEDVPDPATDPGQESPDGAEPGNDAASGSAETPGQSGGGPGEGHDRPGDGPGEGNDRSGGKSGGGSAQFEGDSGGSHDRIRGDSVDVHRARATLTERMAETSGAYGFDVTAQFGDQVVQQHLQANDIVTVFDALLLWYAEHLDDDMPAEEAIGLLLAESDIPIEYPADALISLVRTHGLDGDDTIADLVDAACEETVQFPPQ